MKNKTVKDVTWSYPSSPNADRFGFAHGCWTVETIAGDAPPVAHAGFADRETALQSARALPHPWSALFRHFNPQDC